MSYSWFILYIGFPILLANAAAAAGKVNVQVLPIQPKFSQSEGVHVTLTYTNEANNTIFIPTWMSPDNTLNDPLFDVILDGTSVPYVGPLIKRRPATVTSSVRLSPGQERSVIVQISSLYDMKTTGNYVIQFRDSLQDLIINLQPSRIAEKQTSDENQSVLLQTTSGTCFVEGRENQLLKQLKIQSQVKGSAKAFSACSAKQISLINKGFNGAKNYAQKAVSYLKTTPRSAKPRYTTWFGTFSSSNWNVLRTHFTNIQGALNSQPVSFDCSCNWEGTYAYVYPSYPYWIYLCPVFWSAPVTGTDSKAGTLIHEMSHFSVVVGTADYTYGQGGCMQLASENPAAALMNADSHEYFAENNPVLA